MAKGETKITQKSLLLLYMSTRSLFRYTQSPTSLNLITLTDAKAFLSGRRLGLAWGCKKPVRLGRKVTGFQKSRHDLNFFIEKRSITFFYIINITSD